MGVKGYHHVVVLLAVASMSSAVGAGNELGNPNPHFAAKLSPTTRCEGAISHYGTEGLPPVVLRPANVEYKSSLMFYGAGMAEAGPYHGLSFRGRDQATNEGLFSQETLGKRGGGGGLQLVTASIPNICTVLLRRLTHVVLSAG